MADIYLDSAAMYPPLPCALEAYRNAPFGNPSSEHAVGQAARDALEEARKKIASILDCDADELYFTSGATEACNLAVNSMETPAHIVLHSPYEHHAVSERVEMYYPTYNKTEMMGYAQQLANNETGEIFAMPTKYDAVLCDATSALGHVPVSIKTLGVSYLTGGAHKFGGVLGAGLLYIRSDADAVPEIVGGGQERGMRSGTENVPAICAMAAALEWQTQHMEKNLKHFKRLSDTLRTGLDFVQGHKWNTDFSKPHLPHILNISFDGVDAHALTLLLSQQGIMVSAGAACSNGLNEPSHVIMAMYNDEARARSAIRISLSHENTEEECITVVEAIKEAVAHLRSVS